jgi:AraC-like DNA-binding protein
MNFIAKYRLDANITSERNFIFSYAADSREPIVFSHYVHKHRISSPVTYKTTTNYYAMHIYNTVKAYYIVGGRLFYPSHGDIVLIKPNDEYSFSFNAESDVDSYEIIFPTEFFDNIRTPNPFSVILTSPKPGYTFSLGHTKTDQMISVLKKIEDVIETKSENVDFVAYSYIIRLMDIISAYADKPHGNPMEIKLPITLKQAIDYIHLNYTTLLGIGEVAEHCGITGTYLARLFKKYLQTAPNEYITNLRLSYAKYLLNRDYSVLDACFKSGFSSYSYFISKFKSITGVTPLKYKNGTFSENN